MKFTTHFLLRTGQKMGFLYSATDIQRYAIIKNTQKIFNPKNCISFDVHYNCFGSYF